MPRRTGASRLKGLSRSIISHHFRGRHHQTRVLTAGKQAQCLEAAAASRQAQFQEMSAEDCEMVETMMADYGMDLDPLPYTAPPGDEGLDMSHAGGEYKAFEGLAHEVAGISRCRYVDPCTRSDCIENETDHWNIQMDLLVEAYLDYRYCDSGDGVPHNGMPPSPSDHDGQRVSLNEIELIDIFTLKCDTPNWRLLNACPACFYKLEDEPDLPFDWLVTMDGNNSLKRWDSTIYGTNPRLDSRKVQSDLWIDPDTVDKFTCEVRGHAAMSNRGDDALIDNTAVETNPAPFSCADRWKNAGPEMWKKMFSVFDESGIFIAACRHHFVLLVCDMIRKW
ncbi:hypothetical protein DFH29DRAFT_1007058 [Suillus ampliporus]|nr:hypothetical protein DFH29DRAFT_1007058 [Suillus ampliporus]